MYTSHVGLLGPLVNAAYPNESKPTCLDVTFNLLGIFRINDTNVWWHVKITQCGRGIGLVKFCAE